MKKLFPLFLLPFLFAAPAFADQDPPSGVQAPWIGWFKLEGGGGVMALGAFHQATQIYVQDSLSEGWTAATADMGSEVWSGMMEIGACLDPLDGIALRLEALSAGQFRGTTQYGLDYSTQYFIPYALPFSLNYYRFFPWGTQRIFLTGGVGYTLGVVDYDAAATDYWSSAEFVGGAVGVNAGVGWECFLGKNLAFEASLNGRLAQVSQLTAHFTANGAQSQWALVRHSDGSLGIDAVSNMAAYGESYAPADFSSVDIRCGFTLYAY